MKEITLIIPLYNSNYIEKQLLSIRNLDKNSIVLYTIFIDDGSDNNFINSYKNIIGNFLDLNLLYVSLGSKKGKNRVCKARNTGVKYSKTENLVFIDQETILPYNYLQKIVKHLNFNNIVLGPYYGYNNSKKELKTDDIDFFIENGYIKKSNFEDFRINFYKEKQEKNRIWEFFCGSNFFMKKKIYSELGGFDEKILNWGDEDVEFGYRLFEKGYNIIFDDSLKVLNLSEKLYSHPYEFLNKDNILSLSENWYNNYKKHKTYEYKRYIMDRFSNLKLIQKKEVSKNFSKHILNYSFYKNGIDTIFFRIDDVKDTSNNFIKMLNIFKTYNLKIILGVEPANIDIKTILLLNHLKNKYHNIDIVQHGFNHNNNNYNNSSYYKYEFGSNITYENQSSKIMKGFTIMQEKFGKNFLKVFIPPFNYYDNITERVLGEIGFKIVSSGFPVHEYNYDKNIIQLHSYLDLICDYSLIKYKNFDEIIGELSYYLNRDGFVGIILHPQFMNEDSFRLLIKLIEYTKSSKITVLNFSSFFKKYGYDEK